jgi:parvulin-like peptidyl-prolyl isomerase
LKRFAIMAAIAILFGSLAGCSGGGSGLGGSKKAVAKVNGEEISEAEFYNRVLNVSGTDLAASLNPQGPRGLGKAGEFAMQSLIGEKMFFQVSKTKNALPSEAEITAYIAFAKKYRNPQYTLLPDDPYRTEDDWRRQARSALAFRKMALGQSTVKETDFKTKYDQVKSQLKEQDQLHLRVIDIKDKAKAEKALAKLSKIPFETVALTDSEDPVSGPRNGDIGLVPDAMLQQQMPNLAAAVKKLKVGEYTRTLVEQKLPPRGTMIGTPGQQLETRYFIAQLVENKVGRVPTFEEVKPLMEMVSLQEKDPGAFQRIQTQMTEFRDKAKIEILLKPYEHLMDKPKAGSLGAPVTTKKP